jgi:hypothetical protein
MLDLDQLETRGFVVIRAGTPERMTSALSSLGSVIQRERVALRPGAHAYLAKPGAVPLHTDHPDATWIAWFCEAQDERDGANVLLDAQPVIASLPETRRDSLRQTFLACPPVAGGPPTLAYRVLDKAASASGERLFCSPWLRARGADLVQQSALDTLRDRLKEAAKTHLIRVRLEPGEALIINNGRVLHGRDAIADDSRRVLLRAWIQAPAVALEPRHSDRSAHVVAS